MLLCWALARGVWRGVTSLTLGFCPWSRFASAFSWGIFVLVGIKWRVKSRMTLAAMHQVLTLRMPSPRGTLRLPHGSPSPPRPPLPLCCSGIRGPVWGLAPLHALPVPGPCRACGCLAHSACDACAAARPRARHQPCRPFGKPCSQLPGEGWEGFEPAELLSPVEAFPAGKALLAPTSHRSPLFCSWCSGHLSPFPTAGAVCASPLAGGAMVMVCTLLASSSSLGLRSLSVPSLWNVASCAAVWLLLPVCLCCCVSPVLPHIFWKLVSPALAVAQGPKPFHAHLPPLHCLGSMWLGQHRFHGAIASLVICLSLPSLSPAPSFPSRKPPRS